MHTITCCLKLYTVLKTSPTTYIKYKKVYKKQKHSNNNQNVCTFVTLLLQTKPIQSNPILAQSDPNYNKNALKNY